MIRSRHARSVVVALSVAGVGAAGCAPEFIPASLIQSERVIAVVTEPPEATPGSSVQLAPVIASPRGTLADGDGVSTHWWRCPDDDSDALQDFWECTVPADRQDLGGGVPYTDTVPADLFGEPPAPGTPVDASAASGKLLGALMGYWRVVGAEVRDAAGARIVDSFKRVPVFLPFPLSTLDERLAAIDIHVDDNDQLAPNTNPVLSAVLVHDGAVGGPTVTTVKAGQTYAFAPVLSEDSLQPFFSLQVDLAGLDLSSPENLATVGTDELLRRFVRVQRCEIPTYTWYVTHGRVRREITVDEGVIGRVFDTRGVTCPAIEGDLRTADTEFTAPTGEEGDPLPEDGIIHGWVVLRDGRGGTAVRSFDLTIEP